MTSGTPTRDDEIAESAEVTRPSQEVAGVYELARRPSVVKAAGIAVNLAIVAYLAYALKRRLAHEHGNRV